MQVRGRRGWCPRPDEPAAGQSPQTKEWIEENQGLERQKANTLARIGLSAE